MCVGRGRLLDSIPPRRRTPTLGGSMEDDLSDYERQRLANIARNNAVMASLGLVDKAKERREALEVAKAKARKRERERSARAPRPRAEPVRVSRRLRKQPRPDYREDKPGAAATSPSSVMVGDGVGKGGADDDDQDDDDAEGEEEEEEEAKGIDYDYMPQEPNDLDDHEFQVYILLKKWRLHRHRELEIEPYKICQNRTLCEMVRRRRNDPTFAGTGDTAKLIEVWGIGPSKVDTFGPEMIAILEAEEALQFLVHSRELKQESEAEEEASS